MVFVGMGFWWGGPPCYGPPFMDLGFYGSPSPRRPISMGLYGSMTVVHRFYNFWFFLDFRGATSAYGSISMTNFDKRKAKKMSIYFSISLFFGSEKNIFCGNLVFLSYPKCSILSFFNVFIVFWNFLTKDNFLGKTKKWWF